MAVICDARRVGPPGARGVLAIARARPWAALCLAALAALAVACSKPQPLAGTDLDATPAPDFALADQNGEIVQLAALRGRPVVLTFLFTQCPDVCPLTADKLRKTADLLGAAADQVAFVAVSTDPPHDDAAAAKTFVEQHRLTGRLRFLVGAQSDLQPVWAAYYMYVAPSASDDPAQRAAANYAARTATHTDAVFVIDRQGRERTLLHSDFEPEALASTLKRLLSE
ncbi:MAG TPA: SCO family protein [Chloroflexota bacterium]|jgi:protein SCO1/2